MKLVRTRVLKIQSQPILSEIHAASASVWNECIQLMDWYQWQRGYPHAHDDFWIGQDCEGWMDKHLSKSQPLHSQSIQSIRKQYFKSWKSFWSLKQSGGIANPKPPTKKKAYLTTRWLKFSHPLSRWNGLWQKGCPVYGKRQTCFGYPTSKWF